LTLQKSALFIINPNNVRNLFIMIINKATYTFIAMNIKACIFDLDGVIVDTAVYHYKAWKRLANEMGFYFTEHQNEQLKGVSRIASLELILGWGNVTNKTEAEKLELATRKNDWYTEMIGQMTPAEILPGAREFVQACRDAGLKTAIGSASKNTPTILAKLELLPLFDAVVDGNSVSIPKPDPEVFLKGAEELNVEPTACVVFEDAIAGIEAAINGGMKTVGIGSPDMLTRAGIVVSGLDKMTLEILYKL
jgi:beta-phosphoglucomutase